MITLATISGGLEVNYPIIGDTVPQIDAGLPQYVSYIFSFTLLIVGIVLFAVLVYNGIKYITSGGDVSKLSGAKKRMVSAFIGAIILFSTYIILNTINPALLILSLEDVREVELLPLAEGPYVCNFKIDNISSIISDYESPETRNNAIRQFYEELNNSGKDEKCVRITSPVNSTFYGDEMTYFVIPNTNGSYNYAAIFYKQENGFDKAMTATGAQCQIISSSYDYHKPFNFIDGRVYHYGDNPNQANSVSPINIDTSTDTKNVVFYEGYDYNNIENALNDDYQGSELVYKKRGVSSPITVIEGYDRHGSSWFDDFYCRETTWYDRPTCGIRSTAIDNGIFLVFMDEDSNCNIITESIPVLDTVLPTVRANTYFDHITGNDPPRGFLRSVEFKDVVVIKGALQ